MRTKAGWLLLASGLTFHSGRRLADHPELIAAIEAEASEPLLARIAALEGALRELLNDASAKDDADIGERLRHVAAARALFTDVVLP